VTRTDNLTGIRAAGGDASAAQEATDRVDPAFHEAVRARSEGRYEHALRHVQAAFARAVADDGDRWIGDLGPLLEWELLAESHPPARVALVRARDLQVGRLLAGALSYGVPFSASAPPRSRFALIVHMNEALRDARSTHELFVRLDARMPECARREAFLALPAMVEAGDFALAARFMPEPLDYLDELNGLARRLPASPPAVGQPRLMATLSSFGCEVRLRAAILHGLGREEEALAFADAALAALADDSLRELVRRELYEPGAIVRALSNYQMTREESPWKPNA
jgi:tetratricopeptide (TPR) repeat protein